MKNILITGADGVLGGALCNALLKNGGYNIVRMGYKEPLPTQKTDLLIHCAFARSQEEGPLAQSVEFSKYIFTEMVKRGAGAIINISSKSVYPYSNAPLTEASPVLPIDAYGIAKYAVEQAGDNITAQSETKIMHLRLAGLIGPQYPERVINKMLAAALKNHKINIVGGDQAFSFLDIRDAATALRHAVLHCPNGGVYNVGANPVSIMDMANAVKDFLEEKKIKISLNLQQKHTDQQTYMDSSLFTKTFNWRPLYNLSEMLENIYTSLAK